VSRACLRERISKGCRQSLILHSDNGTAMRAATLDSRLDEIGLLMSLERPRDENDKLCSETLSVLRSTDPTIQAGHSRAMERTANGLHCLWTDTTTSAATVASTL
jgi:transposase InsO family protein